MASQQTCCFTANTRFCHRFASAFPSTRNRSFYFRRRFPLRYPRTGSDLILFRASCRSRDRACSVCCLNKESNTEVHKFSEAEREEGDESRPTFDINLAVILAGFAFEAYTTPPENIGKWEVDAGNCKTVYLSELFVREVYDGQLFLKLKNGFDFPAMDPWGTSDPYTIIQLDGQIAKSKVKWGTKEPTWNEEFSFYIKLPPAKGLQVAAWDANLLAPHKRMGNANISLDSICDGETLLKHVKGFYSLIPIVDVGPLLEARNVHALQVELEGMGGGGKLELEAKYKTFKEIEEEKRGWMPSFVPEFLKKSGLESALTMMSGNESIPARKFVEYAFGQLKSFNDTYLPEGQISDGNLSEDIETASSTTASDLASKREDTDDANCSGEGKLKSDHSDNDVLDKENDTENVKQADDSQTEKHFWSNFANAINKTVVKQFDLPVLLELKWDGFEFLNKIGLQARNIAEASYVESGLAIPPGQDGGRDKPSGSQVIEAVQSSLPDVNKATQDLLKQTESVLGALMVLTATVSKSNEEEDPSGESPPKGDEISSSFNGSALDEKKAEEMRELFSSAESAMEAWAMLASSVGHSSFIKSEFEKICFLDNESTDSQVAIWRDSALRRIVVAFRGTEQLKWKDVVTDLMLVPAGLNPERIGDDFKEEVQVHTGFLSAYDSVRIRIISIIKAAIGYEEDAADPPLKWHVYITGHSLGGALATLLALELSSSRLAGRGAISVTMYNFGSPRVGNKRFAEIYNQKVKDSWRVINHRDIIPTVPRLMGYCHVAHPVYLAAGDLRDALENLELSRDGYRDDILGEATPDVLVSEVMKGEKELIEKILQTEINIFRSIRDGSALMQHMEDFYYISLLEHVKSNYQGKK
ncbi:Probable feruloyl esterase A [Linum perenne]